MLWTDDGGDSWHTGNSTSASNYGVDFVDLNHGWAVGIGGIVYRTTDGGRNWSWSASSTSENLKDVDFVDSKLGWAVARVGAIVRPRMAARPGGTRPVAPPRISTG